MVNRKSWWQIWIRSEYIFALLQDSSIFLLFSKFLKTPVSWQLINVSTEFHPKPEKETPKTAYIKNIFQKETFWRQFGLKIASIERSFQFLTIIFIMLLSYHKTHKLWRGFLMSIFILRKFRKLRGNFKF